MSRIKSKFDSSVRESHTDERAVSPVIGFFVLGLGSEQNATPQASFTFNVNDGNTTITHDGGDTLQAANVNVLVAGTDAGATWSPTPIAAGSSTSVSATSGQEIRVVYTNDNGQTSTLASYTVP